MGKNPRRKQVGKRKPPQLTVRDIPQPAGLPPAIESMGDPVARDKAREIWHATAVLYAYIPFYRKWFHQLVEHNNGDRNVRIKLVGGVQKAIFVLKTHDILSEGNEAVIDWSALAPFPDGWVSDPEYHLATSRALFVLEGFREQATVILAYLQSSPTTVLIGGMPDFKDHERRADDEELAGKYLTKDLTREFSLTAPTISKYAKMAGVSTPRPGKRDHRYSESERLKILQAIVNNCSDTKVINDCRELLDSSKPNGNQN